MQGSQLWGVAYYEEALRPGGVVSHILHDDGGGGLQLCGPQAKVLHDGLSVRPGVIVLGICCQTGSGVLQLLQSRLQATSLKLGRKHCACPNKGQPLLPADKLAAAADQEHLAGLWKARQCGVNTTGCTVSPKGHLPCLDELRQHCSQHQSESHTCLKARQGWRLGKSHHINSSPMSPTVWA